MWNFGADAQAIIIVSKICMPTFLLQFTSGRQWIWTTILTWCKTCQIISLSVDHWIGRTLSSFAFFSELWELPMYASPGLISLVWYDKNKYEISPLILMLWFICLYFSECSDLYVTCQVFSDGQPLCLPTRTSYKPFSTRWKWVLYRQRETIKSCTALFGRRF